jgi:lipoprotein-anchoring transpeptidase ErfK/SrfK
MRAARPQRVVGIPFSFSSRSATRHLDGHWRHRTRGLATLTQMLPRLFLPALALAILLVGAPVAAAAPVRPVNASHPLGNERLSNERTLTRFAHAAARGHIREAPSTKAKSIARLRYSTEDGFPEPYLLLRSRLDEDQRVWIKLRIPGRPNGRTGWVRRGTLAGLRISRHQIVVDRKRRRATLRKQGKRIWSARIGHGKPSTPTPGGRYIIRERIKAMGGIYGPWAFGTSAYSAGLTDWPGGGVIGIHGTNQPHLIPGRPSNGCIRVRNRKIRQLARKMPIGTPLHIK